MQTAYQWMYFAVVAVANAPAVNQAMSQITGNPADSQTFSIPLSADGTEPASHYGTICPVTAEIVGRLQASQPQLAPVVTYYHIERTLDGEEEHGPLLATDSQTPAAQAALTIGANWDWNASLIDMGLRIAVNPDDQ